MKKIEDLASRLRHRIIVEQAIENADGAGGLQISWVQYATIWAEIIPRRANEELFAGQVSKLATQKITIRYIQGLNAKMRLNFAGRIFNIISILNLAERDEVLEILAEEGIAK
jgi:SPP1 family predicted phage head-tail adaptor